MHTRLKLFNSLSKKEEVFRSLVPGRVSMFVCGPTIQDYIHLGHARTYLFYDLLARHFRQLGYEVEFLLNVTDIDESIVRRAREEGTSLRRFLSKYNVAFLNDMKALGVQSVSKFERVSMHLPEMIRQVSRLVSGGHGYLADGSIFFDTRTFPHFGELSGMTEEELEMRPLEISPSKRNQCDFSLWRRTGTSEQHWRSPWGSGTPGWHIQDTALSYDTFGGPYDIHGGARELIYPHHEAEIAQMESLTGTRRFVRYWVHSGLLTLERRKMSKSEGNVFRVRDILRSHDVNALRLYLTTMHHRRDAEFKESELRAWEEKYESMRSHFGLVRKRASGSRRIRGERMLNPFVDSLNDDVDGERAVAYLSKLLSDASRETDSTRAAQVLSAATAAAGILGIRLER